MAVSLRLFGAATLAALFCASQASDSAPDMEDNALGRRVLIRTAKPDGSVDAGIGDLVDNGDAGVEVTPSGEAVLDFGSERGDSSRPGKHHKHHEHRKHGQRHGHGHSHGHEDRKREHPHHGRPSRSGGDDRSSEGQDRHKDVRRGGEEGEEEDSHHGGSFVEVGDMDNSEGLRANFHVDQVATSGGSTTQAAGGGRFREDDDSADRDAEGDDDISEGGDSDDEKDLALQDTAIANEKEEGHEHHDHGHHGNSTAAGLDATLKREIRDAFAIYDVDKNGFLDAKEFKTLIKHTGISRELPAVKWLWDEYDNNKDGKLSVGEVLKMAKDHEESGASFDEEDSSLTEEGGDEEGGYEEEGDSDEDYDLSSLTHEYVTEQFKKHDKDSSGFLEGNEMFALLKENGVDDPEWEDVDSDGDKRMSFKELVTLAGLDEHTS